LRNKKLALSDNKTHFQIIRQFIISILIFVATGQLSGQLNVQVFMNRGINEYFNEKYTDAIHTFNILIRSKPDMAEPHIWRGRAKLSLGDFRGAEFDFTRAVMLDSFNPDAYYYRGVVRSNLYDYYSALDDYKKSLERRPNNPNVFFSRGTTRLRMKDYEAAITDFDTLLLLMPDIEQAYLNRALAKAHLEKYEAAIEDCNHALKLNLFYVDAYIQRGLFRNELEKYEEAMEDFNQAIKLDEDNPLTYFYRGTANIKTGDTLAALKDFNVVIELDPFNDLTFYNRALIHLQNEDYEDALDDFNAVIELNPKNVYTWYNMGIVNLRLEKYSEAVKNFSRAIEIFPDFAAAYMSRSAALQEQEKYEAAKDDYDLAIAIINAVNSGEDYGVLNSRYSVDSTYLQQIIEFEADFNSNNVAGGRIQNRRVLIQLMPNFSVQYIPNEELLKLQRNTGYFYEPLEDVDQLLEDYSLGISRDKYKLPQKKADQFSTLTDSITYFDPFNASNYFRYGTFNAMMMNFNEAIQAFDRSLELDAGYLLSYFNRANIRFELIEHQFSIRQTQPKITITQNPVDENPDYTKPEIPDFTPVIDDYTKVIMMDPGMSFAYYNRGNMKNRMRNFQGAIQDYTAALSIDPNFAEAFYNRALTLIYIDRTREACFDLSKAGELGVQDAYNVIKRYCNK
jgi:tetratricopeptide (TPR) repeat protein